MVPRLCLRGLARISPRAGRPEEPRADLLKIGESPWLQVAEFYTRTGLSGLIERENENARELLVAQLRSPMGVVPFVGRGSVGRFRLSGLVEVSEGCRGVP